MLAAASLHAQEASGTGASDLAKKTQNPVGDLTSIPFQFNWFTHADDAGANHLGRGSHFHVPHRDDDRG